MYGGILLLKHLNMKNKKSEIIGVDLNQDIVSNSIDVKIVTGIDDLLKNGIPKEKILRYE